MAISSPLPAAAEIIQSYADVLRLGSLRVNGTLISWDASAARLPEERLADFGMALGKALRAAQLIDEVLIEGTAYWLCKALSINYALAEVLDLVTRRVGTVCSIESWNSKGSSHPAEYHVELQPGPKLLVGISWGGRGNLISCDPCTARKEVQGTISRVETEFSLPPERGFAPEYHVQMELCKAQQISSQFPAFGCSTRAERAESLSFERLVLAAPLRQSLPPRKMTYTYLQDFSDSDAEEDPDSVDEKTLQMPGLRAKSHSSKFDSPATQAQRPTPTSPSRQSKLHWSTVSDPSANTAQSMAEFQGARLLFPDGDAFASVSYPEDVMSSSASSHCHSAPILEERCHIVQRLTIVDI